MCFNRSIHQPVVHKGYVVVVTTEAVLRVEEVDEMLRWRLLDRVGGSGGGDVLWPPYPLPGEVREEKVDEIVAIGTGLGV